MVDLSGYSLWIVIAVFVAAAAAIGFAGVRLSHVADKLADRTGMGESTARSTKR